VLAKVFITPQQEQPHHQSEDGQASLARDVLTHLVLVSLLLGSCHPAETRERLRQHKLAAAGLMQACFLIGPRLLWRGTLAARGEEEQGAGGGGGCAGMPLALDLGPAEAKIAAQALALAGPLLRLLDGDAPNLGGGTLVAHGLNLWAQVLKEQMPAGKQPAQAASPGASLDPARGARRVC
jgi:hypothetical protein